MAMKVEILRAELKAIQEWPENEIETVTEFDAIFHRTVRAIELRQQIEKLAARN